MNRLLLSDELPYRFQAPRLDPLWIGLGRFSARSMLKKPHRIESIAIEGDSLLKGLIRKGDGILLTPNHTDHADSHLMFALSRAVGLPFYYMAAYQIFRGHRSWVLPRIGVFPVDREGADLTAFKTAVDLLVKANNPLVVFPEGEIYHTADRLTPLREGAVALAATAANKLAKSGKTVWVVPVAIKYRYLDPESTAVALHTLMDDLERRLTWWPRRHKTLVDRIYDYAEAMMGVKEFEYLGATQAADLPDRLKTLCEHIVSTIERRHGLGQNSRRSAEITSLPERVKAIRRHCLDRLAKPETTAEQVAEIRRELHDVFVATQIFSYPGDYVREKPSVERLAETLMKFEEDVLAIPEVAPKGDRRAIIKLGEPIDLAKRLEEFPKLRTAIPVLTSELETRMQGLLDAIGAEATIDTKTDQSIF